MNKANATKKAKIEINDIEWYVTLYTFIMEQKKVRSKPISSKVSTELRCLDWSHLMQEVNTKSLWTFEMGTTEGLNFLYAFL